MDYRDYLYEALSSRCDSLIAPISIKESLSAIQNMPSSLAMHTMRSEEFLQSNSTPGVSHTVKHVHFAPVFEDDRRHSSESIDSIAESSAESEQFWDQDSTATSSMPQPEGACFYSKTGGPCSNSATDGHEFVRGDTRSTQSCACGKLRHSDIRHAATRIPNGKTRRESVQGFDDVKRRWCLESESVQSAIEDEPWGFSSIGAEAPIPARKFGVHHW